MTSIAPLAERIKSNPVPQVSYAGAPSKWGRVDAGSWAEMITEQFAAVADADQLQYAREILADYDLVGKLIMPIGPSIVELQARLDTAPTPDGGPSGPAVVVVLDDVSYRGEAVGRSTFKVDTAAGSFTVTMKPRKAKAPAPAEPPAAPCCDAGEPAPCTECVPPTDGPDTPAATVDAMGWAWAVLGRFRPVADDHAVRFAEAIVEKPDLYVGESVRAMVGHTLPELEARLAARAPAVGRPAPAPLPRLLPTEGRYDLAGLVSATGDAYAAEGSTVGELIAETLRELAGRIRATGARSVAEYRDRAEALDALRADELRAEYFDAGYQSAMQEAGALA